MEATKALIEEIRKNIPEGENVVKYLMWKLDLSKESAYRRMKGIVPFPLEEIRELVLALDFSIDEIMRKGTPKIAESDKNDKNELLLSHIISYQNFVEAISRFSQRSAIFSAKQITLAFIIEYDALFELFFCAQMHRNQIFNGFRSFSKSSIPKEILTVRESILNNFPSFKQREYILDRDLFSNIAREIQYFRRLKLISAEEVETLKLELFQILEKMETEMETGHNEKKEECLYYFSWLDVDTNAICVDCGDKSVTLYSCFGMPVFHNNSQVRAHRQLLESQKKYTILISQSSEFMRAEFIERQKGFIESIDENKVFY
ncbi:MAG: hypothetical protein LBR97_00310 [Dysgonamonadaceae bacterium]|jgi:hypothetical protein|nr:hypothetical protein [Dysgonamonadaceae bacterium]